MEIIKKENLDFKTRELLLKLNYYIANEERYNGLIDELKERLADLEEKRDRMTEGKVYTKQELGLSIDEFEEAAVLGRRNN